jgi:predicted CopG family antitoxin
MATKNISLDEDAYNRLDELKEDEESFSDVVKKITKRKSLREISGIISEDEAEKMRKYVEKSREKSKDRTKRVSDEL